MMRKITQGLMVLLLTTLCSLAYAAPPDKPPVAKSPAEKKAESQSAVTEAVAVLKAEVALMREFHQHILSTVYWSLGTVAVLAVLLVGFSWFTNYRIHERELASLKQELTNMLESRINAFSVESTKNSLSEVKQRTEQAVKEATLEFKQAIASIRGDINACSNSLSGLKYKALNAEARYWELKGVKANVLTRYKEMLEMAIQRKDDTEIAGNIDGLRMLISEGVPIFHVTVGSIVELIHSLPSKFSVQADALLEALKSAKTY